MGFLFTGKSLSIIETTCASEKEARKIARALTEDALAACCQIVPGVSSVYRWQGRLENAEEVVLVIKTIRSQEKRVLSYIERLHGYETPSVIISHPSRLSAGTKAWLLAETTGDGKKKNRD